MEDRLHYRKINCIIGRSIVVFQDRLYYWKNQLYYWKIICDVGRSVVLLEDHLYWRQSTKIDGNYRSRKITARRWLHKYVRAECGASSFTWYYDLIISIFNTDIHLSVWPASCVHSVGLTILFGSISYLYFSSCTYNRCVTYKFLTKFRNLNFWQFFSFL